MDDQKIQMFLATNKKYFEASQLALVGNKLQDLGDNKFAVVSSLEFQNPSTVVLVAVLLGTMGIDRFMIGETGMGILKLFTCGLCGILWVIDIFTLGKKVKQQNLQKVMQIF